MRRVPSLVALALLLATPTLASAAPTAKSESSQKADALFREALSLADKGEVDDACAKFAESEKTEHSSGTLMNVARCDERVGKFAEALEAYTRVHDEAQASIVPLERTRVAERANLAQQRMKELQSKVCRVSFNAPPEDLMSVSIGGRVYRRDELFSLVVTFNPEPNVQTYTLTFTNNRSETRNVPITPGGQPIINVVAGAVEQRIVTVPAATNLNKPAPDESGDGLRTAGWVVGGVGAAALATGALFGAMAMGKQSAVREGCPVEGQPCTTQAGREALDAGKSLATISTVGFIGGGVLLAGGAAMLLWPRDKNEKGSHASAIRIVPAGPGALLHATF